MFENLCHLWYQIVEVASTEYDEHLELMGLNVVEHLILLD